MRKRIKDMKMRMELKVSLYLSFAMAFMLLIFAPLELYFTNITEWWYDIYFLLPVMGSLFLVAMLLNVLVLQMVNHISNRIYRGIVVFYLIAYVCLYVQGNFLASALPLMDGRIINWTEYSIERWKNLLLIIIVTIGIIAIFKSITYEKFEMMVKIVCLFITGVLAATIVVLLLTVDGGQKKMNITATSYNLLTMSSDENFIVLILDCIDAGDFSRIITEKEQYKEIFRDFTYYENVVGGYGYTKHSIPFIISGGGMV